MKNVLRVALVTILLTAFWDNCALAQQKNIAQQKIATVDMRKLFDGFWKTKQARAALEDRRAELTKEERRNVDSLQKVRDEYQKLLDAANDQAISADERAKRQKAAADKYAELQSSQADIARFERQAQTTLNQQSQRMTGNIVKEITEVVVSKAKAAGYAMVLDASGQSMDQTPFLIYTDGQNDLTAAVLAQLNEGAPINLTTPATNSVVPPLTISTNVPSDGGF
jgi:outer membrane protein